jgi:hypothetical protein
MKPALLILLLLLTAPAQAREWWQPHPEAIINEIEIVWAAYVWKSDDHWECHGMKRIVLYTSDQKEVWLWTDSTATDIWKQLGKRVDRAEFD